MGFQIQAVGVKPVKNDTIPHIIIGTLGRILIRKHFFAKQTVFLLLIAQIVLQEDASETISRNLLSAGAPTELTVDAPDEEFFHEVTQLFEECHGIDGAGSHGRSNLFYTLRHRIGGSLLGNDEVLVEKMASASSP